MTKDDWWFHHFNKVCCLNHTIFQTALTVRFSVTDFLHKKEISLTCALVICVFIPTADRYLVISPVNGTFTVEHALNRAFTTLSYNGEDIGDFGDGEDHPGMGEDGDCITAINSEYCCRSCCVFTQEMRSTYPKREYGCGYSFCYLISGKLSEFALDNIP